MDKLFSYIGKLATVITILGTLVAIYFAFHEKRVELDVQTTIAENLTVHETIQDLSVKYYYQDSLEVHNLWRMQWVIRNTGDKTIVGAGNDSQLLSNGLPLRFAKGNQILSLTINNSNNNAVLKDTCLWFKQWRRGEYVELIAFIESNSLPEMRISDRDIIDSEMSYSQYSPETTAERISIIEYFPRWMSKTLKIIYYIFAVIMLLAFIMLLFDKGYDISTKIGIIIIYLFLLSPLLWMIQI